MREVVADLTFAIDGMYGGNFIIDFNTCVKVDIAERRNSKRKACVPRGSKNAKAFHRDGTGKSSFADCANKAYANSAKRKKLRKVLRSHERDIKGPSADFSPEPESTSIGYQCKHDYHEIDVFESSLCTTQTQRAARETKSVSVISSEWQAVAHGNRNQARQGKKIVLATPRHCASSAIYLCEGDIAAVDNPCVIVAHIAVHPLLWESEELTGNLLVLATEYQETSGDRNFFDGFLDMYAGGHGLALLVAVVLWKGGPFFNTKENAQKLKALQESGESDWRKQCRNYQGAWAQQVRGVVQAYLDITEKRKAQTEKRKSNESNIRRARSEPEWRQLEANTLQNLMHAVALTFHHDVASALIRRGLSLHLRRKENRKTLLKTLSAPVHYASSNDVTTPRTLSEPKVSFSDHVETIEFPRGTRW